MREPPDKTTVKATLSFENLSDSSAVYFANCTASNSSESNTSTFFWPAIPDVDFNADAEIGLLRLVRMDLIEWGGTLGAARCEITGAWDVRDEGRIIRRDDERDTAEAMRSAKSLIIFAVRKMTDRTQMAIVS